VVVNDPGLHLTWKDSTQYVKPLPPCFGSPDIIARQPRLNENGLLGLEYARGFFYSYTQIIKSQCDYDVVLDLAILPESWRSTSGWKSWQALVEEGELQIL
jgi:hypothetical protein